MECLRTGAALEPQGVSPQHPRNKAAGGGLGPPAQGCDRTWCLALLACAFVVVAPKDGHGHGMEFLLARLEIGQGAVSIELTADCEASMMLLDEVAARAAMERLFVVRTRAGIEAGWWELAPLTFERRDKLDPQAPLPPDPTREGRPHQLLTALWQWSPPQGTAFQLALPRSEPLDALLWRATQNPSQPVKWRMMIAGDATEWFEVPPAKGCFECGGWWAAGLLLAIAGFSLAAYRRRR